ncbi:CPBP family intramembrane metalloprotease [Bombilactobacillus folatiphilus]|uniref:CPBP family intramembrane metalloprotease n=1 Tax=Bombilactobacillus folatiphilus TaxID=2923362 RepID=A0ABY4P7V8_9LACO|nr:CPBP family intramembrane glutamic endopeptidase [Bombilactobacillus folatiphilus]UQS81670.1 CPBP family intramembrane metalloprotease [Bombilactobacillus folatiphilus]
MTSSKFSLFLKRLWFLAVYLLLYLLAQIPTAVPVWFPHHHTVKLIVCLILILIVLMVALIALLNYSYHRLPPLKTIWLTPRYKLLLFVVLFIGLLTIGWLSNVLPTSTNEQDLQLMNRQSPWLTNLYTIIFAPIVEEYIFRGLFFKYFFPQLKSNCQIFCAIFCSGFAFGFMHVSAFNLTLIPYVLAGMLLAFSYVLYHGKMRYNIALHFLNNFLASLI